MHIRWFPHPTKENVTCGMYCHSDRDFRVGDIVVFTVRTKVGDLRHSTRYKITCIVDDPEYCKEGYVVFGIEREGSRL